MRFSRLAVFAAAAAALTGLATAQDSAKKDDPKDAPKALKGFLPMYWKDLGLSEDQKQKVYAIQGKYNDEIDVLEAKVKELKNKMAKERYELLTADQKKRLEDTAKAKATGK
ncbi:MAG: hypothetical protein ACRC7O_02430 [Fimbriiglobus sp.]